MEPPPQWPQKRGAYERVPGPVDEGDWLRKEPTSQPTSAASAARDAWVIGPLTPGAGTLRQPIPSPCSANGGRPETPPLVYCPTAQIPDRDAKTSSRSLSLLPGEGAGTGDHFDPFQWIVKLSQRPD